MLSPLEKKFNEYIGNIHSILHNDLSYLNEPSFINQLLDRMEFIKRNFVLMNAETEDVYIYQDRLAGISTYTKATIEWVENFDDPSISGSTTIHSLKENIFMLGDMFETSQNLIKSFYPAT